MKLQRKTATTFLDTLNESGVIDPLYELLAKFLNLFKSGCYDLATLRQRVVARPDHDRMDLFLRIFDCIYQRYSQMLALRRQVDFADMIGRADHHVRARDYCSRFRYIIIDEFQDISHGKANLVRALRDQVDGCKLFCVGDDWQSIYRFTGSDLSLMTQFKEHFGITRETHLEDTFRFPARLAEFSSHFIQKNKAQLRKQLKAHKTDTRLPVVVYMAADEEDALPWALADISSVVKNGRNTVFILNRYQHQAKGTDYQMKLKSDYPNLQVEFLTAHASKGKEADYVIVDNLCSGNSGFPSERTDDPVLSLLLAKPDLHDHAEERRLFYVALTRSRNRVYLIANAPSPSRFVDEILEDSHYERVIVGCDAKAADECPSCQTGKLVRRNGANGIFYSCSYYPICSFREEACHKCHIGQVRRNSDLTPICDECGHNGRLCPACRRGLLIERTGLRGPFFGCTLFGAEFNSCSHTENIVVE